MCTPWQQNHVLYIQLYNMHLLLVTKHLYLAAATICILFYLMPDLPIWPAINAIFVREVDSEEYCTQIKQDFYGLVVFIEMLCFLYKNIINICINDISNYTIFMNLPLFIPQNKTMRSNKSSFHFLCCTIIVLRNKCMTPVYPSFTFYFSIHPP